MCAANYWSLGTAFNIGMYKVKDYDVHSWCKSGFSIPALNTNSTIKPDKKVRDDPNRCVELHMTSRGGSLSAAKCDQPKTFLCKVTLFSHKFRFLCFGNFLICSLIFLSNQAAYTKPIPLPLCTNKCETDVRENRIIF
jgi:hypothetical protein